MRNLVKDQHKNLSEKVTLIKYGFEEEQTQKNV